MLNNYTGNQNIPSRARDSDLDALGELFYDKTRPAAQAARCTVRFFISEIQSSAILVPAGTRVTDKDNTFIWETTADAYIAIGDLSVEVMVQCQTTGIAGNGYTAGQINTLVDVYPYYSHCENITESDDGADAATDDEYYEL
ncbi:MAG: baseplate J/gp47 family protein, partial [Sphaerochaetaceae bacterium]|nr:baseplate J/gp47 family protein [Sphaerochaetaceae bacterium]